MKKQQQESADDKMLGKAIAAELRQQLGGVEADCPETETLAAFYDRTLSDRERALWEKHFLVCFRCQEYLAELARLADSDEPPPLLHEQGEEVATDESAGWFYRLAWVIPFLIIAVASAIWYQDDIRRYLRVPQETAMNIAEPDIPTEQPSSDAGVKTEELRAKADKDLAKGEPRRETEPRKNLAADRSSARPGAIAKPQGQAAGSIATLRDRAELADAARMGEQARKSESEENKAESAGSVAPAAAAPPAPQSAPAEAESSALRKEVSPLGGLTIRGAQQKVETKWRVGKRGAIQKADESGGWTRIVSGVDADLFDITFAGNTGWVVGHSGTVLRSTDGGNTWHSVQAPTSEDLVHVSSQSSQQAQVISRSGKTFATTDGGQTWR